MINDFGFLSHTESAWSIFLLPPKVEKEEEKENGDEEGDDTNVYCKLNSPSENVYMSTTNPKQKKGNISQILVHLFTH